MLLASLVLLCLSPSAQGVSGAFPAKWATASAVPTRMQSRINIVKLDGDRSFWNGRQVSDVTIRQFLEVVANDLKPQPLTVLTYSPGTSKARIAGAKALIDGVLGCEPSKCLEDPVARSGRRSSIGSAMKARG